MGKLTQIGHCTADDIFIRDMNLSEEILDKHDFIDVIYYLLFARMPTSNEKRMLNVLLVTGTDHGFTPSSISSRLTYLGAPESVQGALAAGLLGAGNVFLGAMQKSAELLSENIGDLDENSSDEEYVARAVQILESCKRKKRSIPGVGHPIHVNGDPRTPRLREISKECGFYGKHWRLMDAISDQLVAAGKNLPLNAVGATGAICVDMNLDPRIGRGFAVIGRTAGLLAHVMEEAKQPAGLQIWDAVMQADA
ncbi:citryl-CoA lyase [Maricurvus nonylphenolicus]|uniref:citryl-CoA lyase n=1 Tax=Maricurvus nonylphenolicus TaxID=1008307 RepID=UPI0036F3BD8A